MNPCVAIDSVRVGGGTPDVDAAQKRRAHAILLVVCRFLQVSDSILIAERSWCPSQLAIHSDSRLASNFWAVCPAVRRGYGHRTRPSDGLRTWQGHQSVVDLDWRLGTRHHRVGIYWMARWLRIREISRNAKPLLLGVPIPVRSSPILIEPGLVGLFRPVSLLPDGICDRLTSQQLLERGRRRLNRRHLPTLTLGRGCRENTVAVYSIPNAKVLWGSRDCRWARHRILRSLVPTKATCIWTLGRR